MDKALSLAERRRALGLSQEQLAALLGVTQGTVSRNENAADPDRRYALSLDALAMRKGQGEDLAATAAKLAPAKAA
jgi:transcriptional regulator with XRE-family HTH domain